MENSVIVSVVLPMYNAEKHILECIESIKNQTHKNFEVIIIDDGSDDNSYEIVRKNIKNDRRFKLIKFEKNRGVSQARNKGILEAKGRYIAFIDSDDMWISHKLEHQLKFMSENDYAFSCTGYQIFREELSKKKNIIPEKTINYDILLQGNQIPCLTVMIDRKLVNSNIHFQEIKHEDYLLWLELLKKGINCYCLQEVLALYRKSEKSVSGNKFRAALWTWNILYKQEKLGFIKAGRCFLEYVYKAMCKHSKI